MSHGENVMKSNSKWQLRTLAYTASPPKSNRFEEKWQAEESSFRLPKAANCGKATTWEKNHGVRFVSDSPGPSLG